tara:strand:- start:3398 stop:4054 length:657 start_codon:yes stop_codon:yes gene_type:complete
MENIDKGFIKLNISSEYGISFSTDLSMAISGDNDVNFSYHCLNNINNLETKELSIFMQSLGAPGREMLFFLAMGGATLPPEVDKTLRPGVFAEIMDYVFSNDTLNSLSDCVIATLPLEIIKVSSMPHVDQEKSSSVLRKIAQFLINKETENTLNVDDVELSNEVLNIIFHFGMTDLLTKNKISISAQERIFLLREHEQEASLMIISQTLGGVSYAPKH